jgi:hypothetical protein
MSKKNATDADFIFDKAWISLHAFKETNERLAAIASALAAFPELNLAEKDDIRKRVIRKMHTKRSNTVISAKRQKIEHPAAETGTEPPAAETGTKLKLQLKLEPMLPLSDDFMPGVTRLQLNDEPIFSFRFNDWGNNVTCIYSIDAEKLIDDGQFYSGVIIGDTYVVKLLSEHSGLRFVLPEKAAKAQKEYYRDRTRAAPAWNYRALSCTIPQHKITSELTAMRQMQKLSLGPAILGVLVERGNCYDD